MFNIMKSFDMNSLISFGKGFVIAAKLADNRRNRKLVTRTNKDWIKEETKELIQAIEGDSTREVLRELGDVLYVTCRVVAERENISMEDALSRFMAEAGDKWSGVKF